MTASMAFQYASAELDALADARNYYANILAYFGPYLGPRVVEVGAGIGTFAEVLLRHPAVEQLDLIEPAENNYALLATRFAAEPRVRTHHGYLEPHAARLAADALVAVNVLEHVEDDVAFLRAARHVVSPGGRVLLFVPALMPLYGTLDRAFEHYRRYRKGTLRRALEQAGLRPERIRYVNGPGILSWFVAGRVLRKTTLRAAEVRAYDRWIMPWLAPLERRLEPPLGQSLLAIAHA